MQSAAVREKERTAIVTEYDRMCAYGYMRDEGDGARVFFHIRQRAPTRGTIMRPDPGMKISFFRRPNRDKEHGDATFIATAWEITSELDGTLAEAMIPKNALKFARKG